MHWLSAVPEQVSQEKWHIGSAPRVQADTPDSEYPALH